MRAPISIVIRGGGDLAAALMSLGEGLDAGLICDVWLVGGTAAERELAVAAGASLATARDNVAAKGAFMLELPAGAALADGWAKPALTKLEASSLLQALAVDLPLQVGVVRLIRRLDAGCQDHLTWRARKALVNASWS